jgi:tRNA pseudouridine55 synthase
VRVDPFSITDANSINQLKEAPALLAIDDAISRIFSRRTLSPEEVASVAHGRAINLEQQVADGVNAAFTPDGRFIALLAEKGGRAQPILVINGERS